MNWFKKTFKCATFIDEVQVSDKGKNWISLWINGRKYEYKDVPVEKVASKIKKFKAMDDRKKAGSLLSGLIRSLSDKLHSKSR